MLSQGSRVTMRAACTVTRLIHFATSAIMLSMNGVRADITNREIKYPWILKIPSSSKS
jgi:hypothetical protein